MATDSPAMSPFVSDCMKELQDTVLDLESPSFASTPPQMESAQQPLLPPLEYSAPPADQQLCPTLEMPNTVPLGIDGLPLSEEEQRKSKAALTATALSGSLSNPDAGATDAAATASGAIATSPPIPTSWESGEITPAATSSGEGCATTPAATASGSAVAAGSQLETSAEKSKRGMHKVVTAPCEVKTMMGEALDSTSPICVKCRYPITDILRARLWTKNPANPTFCCRTCNCAVTMQYKKLDAGMMENCDMSLEMLSSDEAEEFFKKTHDCLDEKGNLKWSLLKELICDTWTSRRVSQKTVAASKKEFPLSVWERKGFDIQQIREHGTKHPHPVFEEVWSAPLRVITDEEVNLV